jgi:hypothetical protein
MTSTKAMGRKAIVLAAGLVVGAMALAAPASAAWWGNGQWHQDNRWNNYNDRYYGYNYRAPPVVYATPYNYGYVPPPVVYDNVVPTPGFSLTIRP